MYTRSCHSTKKGEKMTDKKTPNKINTNVVDRFNTILAWVDGNILPVVALPVLAILAGDSIYSHLKDLPDQSALAVAIAIAAILAVKSRSKN